MFSHLLFCLLITAVTLAKNCYLSDWPTSVNGSVGDRDALGFTIHALDRYNNSQLGSGDNFTVFATLFNTSVSARLNWTFVTVASGNQDGTYYVSFGPEQKGLYSIYVRLTGNDIAGSPFLLKVRFGKCVRADAIVYESVIDMNEFWMSLLQCAVVYRFLFFH